MDSSRKDSKEKKSLDIQITVKGDKRKNEVSNKKISLSSSHRSSEDSSRKSHRYSSKENYYEEDERSVVKSNSIEREIKKTSRNKDHKLDQNKSDRYEPSSRKDKDKGRDRDKQHSQRNTSASSLKARRASKEDTDHSVSAHQKPKDLRAKIEEKTKAKNVDSHKISVMDESEFVPDYEDTALEAASDNEQASPASSSNDENVASQKQKSEDNDGDLSGSKTKKAKKKHKHKEKKDKKEKHKHKKKKHKNKKSKEKETE